MNLQIKKNFAKILHIENNGDILILKDYDDENYEEKMYTLAIMFEVENVMVSNKLAFAVEAARDDAYEQLTEESAFKIVQNIMKPFQGKEGGDAKKTVSVTANYEYSYDENSKEFQEALASFRELIDSSGTIDDMLKHVTHNLRQFGLYSMVEGVGYLKTEMTEPKGSPFSGIIVIQEDPFYYYEME